MNKLRVIATRIRTDTKGKENDAVVVNIFCDTISPNYRYQALNPEWFLKALRLLFNSTKLSIKITSKHKS